MLSPDERDALDAYHSREKAPAQEGFRATPGWVKDAPSGERSESSGFIIPESQVGSVVSAKGTVLPTYSFEFYRFDIPIIGQYALNAGTGHDNENTTAFIAFDRKFPMLFGLELGPYIGYHVESNSVTYGLHLVGIRW